MGIKTKDPEQARYVKNAKKAISNTKKVVKPVSKDTNKTRRKVKKPTKGNIDG